MIARFIEAHEFDVGEFLSQDMRNHAKGKEKYLLKYPSIITHIYLDVGVQELPEHY